MKIQLLAILISGFFLVLSFQNCDGFGRFPREPNKKEQKKNDTENNGRAYTGKPKNLTPPAEENLVDKDSGDTKGENEIASDSQITSDDQNVESAGLKDTDKTNQNSQTAGDIGGLKGEPGLAGKLSAQCEVFNNPEVFEVAAQSTVKADNILELVKACQFRSFKKFNDRQRSFAIISRVEGLQAIEQESSTKGHCRIQTEQWHKEVGEIAVKGDQKLLKDTCRFIAEKSLGPFYKGELSYKVEVASNQENASSPTKAYSKK